jgi:hypothetical protein
MNLTKFNDRRFQAVLVNSGAMTPTVTLTPTSTGAVRCTNRPCKGRFMRKGKDGTVRCAGCNLRAKVAR